MSSVVTVLLFQFPRMMGWNGDLPARSRVLSEAGMDSQRERSLRQVPYSVSSPLDLPGPARSPLSEATEPLGMPGVTQAWKRGAVETVTGYIRPRPVKDLESPALTWSFCF